MFNPDIDEPLIIKEFETSDLISLTKEDVDYLRHIVQEDGEKKIELTQHDEKYIIKAKQFVGAIPLKHSTHRQLIINPKLAG